MYVLICGTTGLFAPGVGLRLRSWGHSMRGHVAGHQTGGGDGDKGRFRRYRVLAFLCLVGTSLGMGNAGAQEHSNSAPITREPNGDADPEGKGDTLRVDDSYRPRGIEMRKFLFFPAVEMDVAWTDNVFATKNDAKSDRFVRITPSVRFRSRFIRHELNLTGELEKFIFDRYSNDDRLNGNVSADGKLDIQKGWEATGYINYADRAEDRSSPDVTQGVHPTNTYTLSGQVDSRLQQGRVIYQGGLSFSLYDFGNNRSANGEIIDNNGRDRNEYEATARVGYEIFPNYYAMVAGAANTRDYDSVMAGTAQKRSSDGFRLESGIGIDVTDLIRGDFLVGYFAQSYDNSAFSDPSGFSVRARFNWTPSRMTVVAPSLERSVQETVRDAASSIVRTAASLTVRHEFARNFVATFIGNVAHEDYEASTDNSWSYDARLRGIYALNRELYFAGEARYRSRAADSGINNYDQITLMVRVGARYC